MTATAESKNTRISVTGSHGEGPILVVTGIHTVAIKQGTVVEFGDRVISFDQETKVKTPGLVAGNDYALSIDASGDLVSVPVNYNPLEGDYFAGFHLAPGGNAAGRSGGSSQPEINPYSLWDINFRPACPDPRGMALVISPVGHVWVDIYLLGIDHNLNGSSRFGVVPATGRTLDLLDYKTAIEILDGHGKRLLTYDEFRAAAFGVTEKTSADNRPAATGLDAARTSRFGIMQATGNLWVWGTDGDAEYPRASLFGGSWFRGGSAGSRGAHLDSWPGNSYEGIGARGASDHLTPA